jgi:hypothetical protein
MTSHAVTSADGIAIGYWTSGDGPPLVLVHGTAAEHTRWRPVLPLLEPHAMVHTLDRRGRGGSGDHPDYALDREFEDVSAVVRSLADATGCPVHLLGHSIWSAGRARRCPAGRSRGRPAGALRAAGGASGREVSSGVLERLEALVGQGRSRSMPGWIRPRLAELAMPCPQGSAR